MSQIEDIFFFSDYRFKQDSLLKSNMILIERNTMKLKGADMLIVVIAILQSRPLE